MESNSIALDITCTETAPCCLTMTVTVPSVRAKSVYDSMARKVSGQIKLPGFRSGKIPSKILLGRFGQQIIAETTNKLLQDSVAEAVKEKGLHLAGQPVLADEAAKQYVSGQDFTITVNLEVFPELVLPEYKGIQVTRNTVEISDTEVEEMIQGWLEQRSTFDKVDRPAQKNDMLKLSYQADAPEELLSDSKMSYLLKAENTWLMLREPEMLPGTSTALLEVSAGMQKDVEIAFPENFRIEGLKGKTFLYHFSITEVQGQVIPPLDEKIFQEVGVKDRDELYARVRENLAVRKNQEEDEKVAEQVMEALLSGQDFAVPPTMLKHQLAAMVERQRQALQRSKVAEEELKAQIAAYESEAEQQAANIIRRGILLQQIARQEKITITQAEVARVIGMLAQREGITQEVAFRQLRDNGQLDSIPVNLVESKVIDLLTKAALVTEVKA